MSEYSKLADYIIQSAPTKEEIKCRDEISFAKDLLNKLYLAKDKSIISDDMTLPQIIKAIYERTNHES